MKSSDTVSLDDVIKMRDILEAHNVPEESRSMMYLDLNGERVFLNKDTEITESMYDAMPSWIKCLFVSASSKQLNNNGDKDG